MLECESLTCALQDIAMGLIRSRLLAIQQEQELQRIAGESCICFAIP